MSKHILSIDDLSSQGVSINLMLTFIIMISNMWFEFIEI